MTSTLRIAALISGGGRTVCNLQQVIGDKRLDASIVRVIASREGLSGIERTRNAGLDVRVPDKNDYQEDLVRLIQACQPDLICLCGYLRKLDLHSSWHGRVINIHPSLLPRHGGKGMYGRHVHKAVLESGDAFSGCTVHFVDEEYDHGPILLQRACPVKPGDTSDRLAARVFEQECLALPKAIDMVSRGVVDLVEGRVKIDAACELGRGSL